MIMRLSTALPLNVDKRRALSLFVAVLMVFCSCSNNNTPDVSGIKVELRSQRFDKALASIDTNNISAGLQQLKKDYPFFLDFYLDTLMGLGVVGNYADTSSVIANGFRTFLTHKDYRGLLDTIAAHYPDTKSVDESLSKGFQYHKYYFPDYHVPEIIYTPYWLNKMGVFSYDTSIIGVCLDMFLGASYPYYKSVGVPEYLSAQLSSVYIPVAVFKTIHRDNHPFVFEGRTLLDMMVQRGKEAYYLEHVLPFISEEVRFAYTAEQVKWCTENEASVYNFFISQNYLYETNFQKILRYVIEGPSAAGMSDKSPGDVGTWLGLQIVKAYMKEHPKTTLSQLLSLKTDAQAFLQESKYKPK